MTLEILEKQLISCDAVYHDKEKDEEIHCNNSASHEFVQNRQVSMEQLEDLSLEQEMNFETRLEQKGWDINEDRHLCPECCERLKKGEIKLA